MKAFAIDGYKADLTLREMPDPVAGPGEVVVAIGAASVNPLDVKLQEGAFKAVLPYRFPLILGHDFAGTVIALGNGANRFKIGDKVFGRPAADRIGTFAERIAVAEKDLAFMPASISIAEAAALPLVSLTAWQALVERANLQPGQRVLIHAGSGGVGTVAIQLAKHLGAHVATTVGTDNVDLAKQLGANTVIDYRKQEFETLLNDYDVVLHSLDADTLEKSVTVLKSGGRLISISGPPDAAFARLIGANWFVRQVLRLASSGIRSKARKLGVGYEFLFMRPDGAQLGGIAELVDAGAIRPIIDSEFAFADTHEAMERVASGRARGKVVIQVA